MAVLPWVAGAALAAFGYHEYSTIFAPGRNKKGADAAAVASAETDAQAKVASERAAAVAAAIEKARGEHAASEAKHDAVDAAASGFVAGATIALQADPSPTPAEQAALALLGSASSTLGQPLTPDQRAMWVRTVGGLIAQNAEAKAALAAQTSAAIALRASLDATVKHAAASDAHASELAGQLEETNAALAATAAHAADLTSQAKAWADHEPDLLARIKALGGLIGVMLIGLVWYEIKRKGLTGALHDAVALKEHVQMQASALGADPEKLKAAAETWWADDPKAKTFFDKTKCALRL